MLLAPGATIMLIIFGLILLRLLSTYGVKLGIERKVQKKIAWLVILVLFGITVPLTFTSILHNPFMLWCWICGATIIYIIYRSVEKSKAQQINPSKTNKNEELIISIHLNGGNKFKGGETLEVTEGLKIYDSLDNGSKVITDWQDYDFWQITSNKSNRSFEWIREDQNANYSSTLKFWEGGNEHELRENISEDMAIDIILDCNWIQIPGITFENTNLYTPAAEKELAIKLKSSPNSDPAGAKTVENTRILEEAILMNLKGAEALKENIKDGVMGTSEAHEKIRILEERLAQIKVKKAEGDKELAIKNEEIIDSSEEYEEWED